MTKKFKNSWTALAEAIILSGIKEYDERFLNSSWFDDLQEMVALDSRGKDGFESEKSSALRNKASRVSKWHFDDSWTLSDK